jgi:hypothetical protein
VQAVWLIVLAVVLPLVMAVVAAWVVVSIAVAVVRGTFVLALGLARSLTRTS